ncbi:MAG: trigger factor [candidate division Zixibacteria bacterium]|nr:trigger factor [candidate division Zixibacteria bacterium]
MDYTYNITEDKDCKRIIEAEIPKDKVDEKFNEVFKLIKKEAKIPGFRPGKVPISVIKSRFAKDAAAEVGERLVEEAVEEIVKEAKLSPISPPVVSDIDIKQGEPINFTASIEVAPEIKIEKTTGFTIKKGSETITNNDVDRAYAAILDIESTLEISDEPAKEGNFVTVDMEKTFDLEDRLPQKEFKNFGIELAKETALPAFFDGLMGMKPDDEKEIYVEYPMDYPEKALTGAKLKFKVKVIAVKKKVQPEMNEEFFKKFGDGIKSPEEFKEKIKLDLQARRNKEIQEDIREQVIKSVILHNQFDLPQTLLDRYLEDVVEDFKKESKGKDVDESEIREKYRPIGIRVIRWSLLMHKIAEQQGIKAEKEDVDKWIESFADRYNMTAEQAKEMLKESRKVQEVKEAVLEAKVQSYILDNSEIVDAE